MALKDMLFIILVELVKILDWVAWLVERVGEV